MKMKCVIVLLMLSMILSGCGTPSKKSEQKGAMDKYELPSPVHGKVLGLGDTINEKGITYKLLDYKLTKNYFDYGDFYIYDYVKALEEHSDSSGEMKNPDRSWMFFRMEITNTGRDAVTFDMGSLVLFKMKEEMLSLDDVAGEVRSYDLGSEIVTTRWLFKQIEPEETLTVRIAALVEDSAKEESDSIALMPFHGMGVTEIDENQQIFGLDW